MSKGQRRFTVTLNDDKLSCWSNFKFSKVPVREPEIPLARKNLQETIKSYLEHHGYSVESIWVKSKNGLKRDFRVTVLLA